MAHPDLHDLLDPAVLESLTVRLFIHHHVGAHGDDDHVFAEQLAHARRIADTTRLRKTAEVLADERLRSLLLVCMRGFRRDRAALNCGRCYKCARVLLHAEALRALDAAADTFDMAAYRRGRNHSVMRLLRFSLGPTRNAADVDLLRFLAANGFDFPRWSRPAVAAALLLHGRRHSLDA